MTTIPRFDLAVTLDHIGGDAGIVTATLIPGSGSSGAKLALGPKNTDPWAFARILAHVALADKIDVPATITLNDGKDTTARVDLRLAFFASDTLGLRAERAAGEEGRTSWARIARHANRIAKEA